jgi:hypothetical protein
LKLPDAIARLQARTIESPGAFFVKHVVVSNAAAGIAAMKDRLMNDAMPTTRFNVDLPTSATMIVSSSKPIDYGVALKKHRLSR